MRSKIVCGFSLIELLITVAVLGIVAGMVIGLTSGAQATSETKMIQSELAEIRKACQQFKRDMGDAPHYLAELFRSPAPAALGGGWNWRTATPVDARLYTYDPATSRGWNGPYLQLKRVDSLWPDAQSQAQHLGTRFREKRIVTVSGTRACELVNFAPVSDPPAILLSHYITQSQSKVAESEGAGTEYTNYSHYELDFSDAAGDVAVIFVNNPESVPNDNVVVARLSLGMKP